MALNPRIMPPAIGAAVVAILLHFTGAMEGKDNAVYFDGIGRVNTACFGHTGPELKRGMQFSDEQCAGLLTADLKTAFDGVSACVTRDDLDPHVWASLTDLAFNVGVGPVCASTMVRKINAGEAAPCDEFMRWIKAGGKDCRVSSSGCRGIVTRRRAERALCEAGNLPDTAAIEQDGTQ
jgi:lysozyme